MDRHINCRCYFLLYHCSNYHLGAFFSIRYTQKEYREDARQRIMPFIAVSYIDGKENYRFFVRSDESKLKEIDISKHYIIKYEFEKGIEYPVYLSQERATAIARNGHVDITDEKTGITFSTLNNHYFYLVKLKMMQ